MPESLKKEWPEHFRYVDSISPDGVTIVCSRYAVIKETTHCYWLVPNDSSGWWLHEFERTGKVAKSAKRVLKDSWRRFAYPDKGKALESYKVRKRRQLGHAELTLERAKAALDDIKDLAAINDEHVCSGGDYIKQLSWGDY